MKAGKSFYERHGPGHFTFDLTVFQPYAGSRIWDSATRNDAEFSDTYRWRFDTVMGGKVIDPECGGIYFNKVDFTKEQGFYKGVPGEYRAFIRTRDVTPEEFVALRDKIEFEVRDVLHLPQLAKITPAMQYEHSMGQPGPLGHGS